MVKVKWPKVLDSAGAPLLRWIELGNGTMFRIAAFFCHGKDFPAYGIQISIDRVGSFFFKLHMDYGAFHWVYVSEKLCIPESDARAIADWLNAQRQFECEQQGEYNSIYINECEPYRLAGERLIMPLVPEIIE